MEERKEKETQGEIIQIMVLKQEGCPLLSEHLAMSRDTFSCQNYQGRGHYWLLEGKGQGLLLESNNAQDSPLQPRIIWFMLIVPKLRNPKCT